MNPINIVESDFNNAWSTLVNHIIKFGEKSIIGDYKNPHPIIGSPGMITLKNNAIKQIGSFEIDYDYPFKAIQQYCDQFTYEWQKENGTGGFDYTYFSRLTNGINQLDNLRFNLEDQIINEMSSNRNHAITWIPKTDSYSDNPPCLQSINVKYIGDNKVDIFLYWRSRDAYTAWQSNIIAITKMLNKYVVDPNNCTIRSIIDISNNYHIYNSDLTAAKNIRQSSPQINYRR